MTTSVLGVSRRAQQECCLPLKAVDRELLTSGALSARTGPGKVTAPRLLRTHRHSPHGPGSLPPPSGDFRYCIPRLSPSSSSSSSSSPS